MSDSASSDTFDLSSSKFVIGCAVMGLAILVAGQVVQVPLMLLGLTQLVRLTEQARKTIYVIAGMLTLVGIFAMRWNVVIGGQLFSKSFLGYTTYKMGFATREGLLPALIIMVLPFLILAVLVRIFPPWGEEKHVAKA